MTNTNEEKINKLLDFPYDAFLMVRLEYVQILGDELEAKLLRIIEKYVDMERRRIYQKTVNSAATNGQVAEITKDVWVPISYRLFMNDLFGTVTSENTVKKALKKMIDKRIIFQRFQPKKKYDAPEYKIHVNPLQTLLSLLTNPGYQLLIPSYIDTLKELPPQELTPSECQELIPLAALRVSKVDTNITENTNNNREVITEKNNCDESDTPTVAPPLVGALTLPSKTEAFIEKLREWRIEDEQPEEDITQAETVKVPVVSKKGQTDDNNDPHRRNTARHPSGDTGVPADSILESQHSPVDSKQVLHSQVQTMAEARPQGHGLEQNTSTPTPAQAPSPQSEQAAPGLADSAHGTREAAPQAPAQAAESAEQHAHTAATTRQSAKREKKAEPAKPEFTPEGETLYQDWCSLFHVKIPRTKAIILAANDLYEPIAYWSGKLDIPRAEVLKRIMNWQYKNNANYYGEGRGVKLFDVHRDFEEWQSAAQRKLDRALRIVSTDEPVPTVSGRPRLDVPPEYLAMMMGATS